MLRLKFSIELNYEIDSPGCDFIFSIHAAQTPHQIIVAESLSISQSLTSNSYKDPVTHTRFLRLKAFAGPLTVQYDATVDLDHYTAQPAQIGEVTVANLPGAVLPYIYPSRYCQSDRLPAGNRALHEPFALLDHLLELLLAHGAAQQVGVAQRIARQPIGDLHHLLLVDDDAVGLLEQFLQLRQVVLHGAAAPLALDEIVHHAALNRTGAVQRGERSEVFQAARLVAPQDVAHAARFELEYAAGEALAEDGVSRLVVERQVFGDEVNAVPLLDKAQRVLDQGESGQAQKVHLEELELIEAVHIELRHDFIAVGLVERDELLERLGRNHHAGGVHGAVARQAFQAQRHFQDVRHARVFPGSLVKAGLLLDGLFERNVQDVGDHLGDALHVLERHLQHTAHILDGGARPQRVEGDDLGHLLAAVFLGDVLDHLAAPVHTEVHIDIGHADAFGVQEALEERSVLQRVDIGDGHGVPYQAAGGRSAPRTDRDAVRLGVADEVPDDQEVPGELHLLDHPDLAV